MKKNSLPSVAQGLSVLCVKLLRLCNLTSLRFIDAPSVVLSNTYIKVVKIMCFYPTKYILNLAIMCVP